MEKMQSQFRFVAKLEAISFLILLSMMILKYGYHQPIGVLIMGPLHGMLYLVYAAGALNLRATCKWDIQKTLIILAAGSMPFGGFVIDRKFDQVLKASA